MNVFIHTLMYGYYALAAIRIRLPKIISIMITSMQTIQMVIGPIIALYWTFNCYDEEKSYPVKFVLIIYSFFGVLFGNFMIRTYFRKEGKHSLVKTTKFDYNSNIQTTKAE